MLGLANRKYFAPNLRQCSPPVLRVTGQYDCDLAVVEKLTTLQSWTFTDSIPWVAKMILSRGRWIVHKGGKSIY